MTATRRRTAWSLCSAAAALVISMVACILLYAVPSDDRTARTDVADVLGPPTDARLALAERLVRERNVRAVVITASAPGSSHYTTRQLRLCRDQQAIPVYCVTPVPFTTQGEAQILRQLAIEQGWRSATVITQTSHVARARAIVSLCFPGTIRMLADRSALQPSQLLYQFAYQSAAFVKLSWQRLVEGDSFCA